MGAALPKIVTTMIIITTPVAAQIHFAHALDTILHATTSGARLLQVNLLVALLLLVERIPECRSDLLSADKTLNAFSLASALTNRMPLRKFLPHTT